MNLSQPAGISSLRHRCVSLSLVLMLVIGMISSSLSFGGRALAAQTGTVENTTADITPATALAYVSVNLDQHSDQWTLSQELLERAGLTEALDESGLDSSETASEADEFLGGYAAFVLSTLPTTPSLDGLTEEVSEVATDPSMISTGSIPSGFAVILQNPDPDAIQDFYTSNLADLAEENGTTVETVTHEGVDISVVAGAIDGETGIAIARIDDSIIIGTIADDLFPIIDTANGDADPLSGSDAFTTLKDGLNADWLSFGMVNGTELLAQAEAQDPEVFSQVNAGSIAQLDSVTGFAFWADQPGFRMDTLSIAGENGVDAAANPTLSGDFASKVSGDSLFFANGSNINQYGILDTLGLVFAQALVGTDGSELMPSATPLSMDDQSAAIFEQAASLLGFNIKADFLDQLGGEFGMAISASDVTSPEPQISAIFATGTEDSTKVTDVASKISFILASAVGSDVLSSREIGTDSVTTVDLSGSGAPLSLEYGVVGDELLIGVNDGIDSYVNGPVDSLADNEIYQQTLAALPSDPTGITFVNVQGLLPLVDEATSTLVGTSSILDASPECATYDTQTEAQEAYDADQFANFDLDQDFDGTACEDFFNPATPDATPEGPTSSINVQSVGTVSYVKDGNMGTSTIILIGE